MAINRKTCLVTGCSSGGVGSALAEAFKDKGYHVFATARSPSKVPQTLHTASNVTVLALDVTSSESIAAAAEAVQKQTGGKLDVLINNAGLGLNMPGLDTPMDEARKLFDLNFFGALEMIQAFGPMLVTAKGCIVNNSSVGGLQPFPFSSMYNATKAALIIAGEAWRLEMAPLGVRVITLLAGGITTNFLANLQTPAYPEKSYYLCIKDMIEEQPAQVPFGVRPEVFAHDVLRQVEKGTTGKFWVGGGVCIARFALWLFPQSALDRISLYQKPFTKKLAEEHKKTA
ncbi:NAD(P)-binding protein [Melanomma pulvis-pyrius CBS 109.77]|uniref:NAD(P)-binding protein n=1 Tax=Melanomma pulvis-pyrius CBS 109.77 TaxID=1314802 RepID=A0A6A6XGS2_9PLEO|nr:NAD(P)-binding protein [Melanomma pulvis-pyrius CBS 109.77]